MALTRLSQQSLTAATGTVVQTKVHQFDDHTSVTGGYADVTGSSFTFTPLSTSNKLIITADLSLRYKGNSTERASGTFAIHYNGSRVDDISSASNRHEFWYTDLNKEFYIRQAKTAYVTAASTSAVTIKLQIAKYNGDSIKVNDNNGDFVSTITVMEIVS